MTPPLFDGRMILAPDEGGAAKNGDRNNDCRDGQPQQQEPEGVRVQLRKEQLEGNRRTERASDDDVGRHELIQAELQRTQGNRQNHETKRRDGQIEQHASARIEAQSRESWREEEVQDSEVGGANGAIEKAGSTLVGGHEELICSPKEFKLLVVVVAVVA
jgi:hypothetical protein